MESYLPDSDETVSEAELADIPIRNIYYLLCYAWHCLEERDLAEVGDDGETELVNLFARLLIRGVGSLLRRGLDRGYVGLEESIPGIKGRLLLEESLKGGLFELGKARCRFDDFSYDVLHNRILNETLLSLLRVEGIAPEYAAALKQLLYRLPTFTPLALSEREFRRVQLHRGNSHYRFLLNICELVFSSLIPLENGRGYLFRNFLRDRRTMAVLFESFVRNFYKVNRPDLLVKRTDIRWKLTAKTGVGAALLPKMETDVTVEFPDRTVIIDTKYYLEALSKRKEFDSEKFRTANLNQMYAYLGNADQSLPRPLTGILLYPKVGRSLDEEFTSPDGDRICFKTIDLQAEWGEVEERLAELIR